MTTCLPDWIWLDHVRDWRVALCGPERARAMILRRLGWTDWR